MNGAPALHGLMIEFETPEELLLAARAARDAGYTRMDAYTPVELHGLDEALGMPPSRLPLYVLIGGIVGATAGYFMQYWMSAVNYPINVGGRPYASWPSFVIIAFELTILCAALTAVVGMLTMNGLPRPHHPVFNVPRFALASRDRFFLCIEAGDPLFDRDRVRAFLQKLEPHEIADVDA